MLIGIYIKLKSYIVNSTGISFYKTSDGTTYGFVHEGKIYLNPDIFTAESLPEIEFTRENYNKLFPYSKIDTPIETVKIGAHQFEKLKWR